MTSSSEAARPSPLGLRAFHVVVFTGFAASAVAGMHVELLHLFSALTHRWHFGTVPSPLGTAAALAAIGLGAALVVFFFRQRSAPLWISGAILVAFGVSWWQQGYPIAHRSPAGANLAMMEVGKKLHEAMRQRLQDTGAVPGSAAEWEASLTKIAAEDPPVFRTRFFGPVPWTLRTLAKEGDFLPDAPPGTFTIYVPLDNSRFTITMIGLNDAHEATRLRDQAGQVVELRGTYTPDTRR